MTCNALYLQKFNSNSLLSLLPNDIFKIVKKYVVKQQQKQNLKNWFREMNLDKDYLRAVRQIEQEENVKFPIVPVLDMADKNWRKKWPKILKRDYSNNVSQYYPKKCEYDRKILIMFCRPGYYWNRKEGKRKLRDYIYFIKSTPRPYKTLFEIISTTVECWIWNFAQDDCMNYYLAYQNPNDKNPMILISNSYEEKTICEDNICQYLNATYRNGKKLNWKSEYPLVDINTIPKENTDIDEDYIRAIQKIEKKKDVKFPQRLIQDMGDKTWFRRARVFMDYSCFPNCGLHCSLNEDEKNYVIRYGGQHRLEYYKKGYKFYYHTIPRPYKIYFSGHRFPEDVEEPYKGIYWAWNFAIGSVGGPWNETKYYYALYRYPEENDPIIVSIISSSSTTKIRNDNINCCKHRWNDQYSF